MLSTLPAGDSGTWTYTNTVYTSALGWTIKAVWTKDGDVVELTGSASGSVWTFTVTPTQSAALAHGLWIYYHVAFKAAERVTLESGAFTVSRDPFKTDSRIKEIKVQLADIENTIAERIKTDAATSFSMRSANITKETLRELRAQKAALQSELNIIVRAKRQAEGNGAIYSSTISFKSQ